MNNITTIAYYLPQFHRIKFNDEYWGKGFTEWTNAMKAKPLFKGHYQPHIPADLGFYDLTLSNTRKEQAELAAKYGINGFCYWHYWLGKNKLIMEKPFQSVLLSKEPNYPFCLAWANHDWHNLKTKEIILKQEYEGEDDCISHFNYLLPAFKDERYMKIDNKPIFVIYKPLNIPNIKNYILTWNKLIQREGFKGIYFIGIATNNNEFNNIIEAGFNAINPIRLHDFEFNRNIVHKIYDYIKHHLFKKPYVYEYKKVMNFFISDKEKEENIIPTIISGWDHTPRSGEKGLVLHHYKPTYFSEHVQHAFKCVEHKKNKIVFIRAWNEWAEGNHLEHLNYKTS